MGKSIASVHIRVKTDFMFPKPRFPHSVGLFPQQSERRRNLLINFHFSLSIVIREAWVILHWSICTHTHTHALPQRVCPHSMMAKLLISGPSKAALSHPFSSSLLFYQCLLRRIEKAQKMKAFFSYTHSHIQYSIRTTHVRRGRSTGRGVGGRNQPLFPSTPRTGCCGPPWPYVHISCPRNM